MNLTPSGSSSRPDHAYAYTYAHNDNGWPPNVANPHHRVDFRRSWVPSPEMPLSELGADGSLPGIGEDEDEDECAPAQGPSGPRRAARTRNSRTYGGEENQKPNPNSNPNYYYSHSHSNHGANAKQRSVSVSTSSTASVGKRPLRPSSTIAAAAHNANAHNAHTNNANNANANANVQPGDEHDPHVTRTRQQPAAARRPRPALALVAREQGRERERERDDQGGSGERRRSSWLFLLSPKKLLFSARKRRSVAVETTVDASFGSHLPQNSNADDVFGGHTHTRGHAHGYGHGHGHGQKREGDRAHPAEWRAYGMWARPRLGKQYGDMIVRNATPLDRPRDLSPPQVDAMFASLWEDGRPNPDGWIPRVRHASLPPRPDLWPTPRQSYDPLPQELQLNPFLVHHAVGRPPIHFDLRTRAEDITLGERLTGRGPGPEPPSAPGAGAAHARWRTSAENANNSFGFAAPANATWEWSSRDSNENETRTVPFRCDGPNGAQPATYPGVPRLPITTLAGDPHSEFPWPVTVLPHHEALPVLVSDVVSALIANFEERLSAEEVEALSDGRRVMLYQAYWRRMRLAVGGRTPAEDDGLRRVDYLGDAVYFRGLGPNPSGDGFMLFMGPPP